MSLVSSLLLTSFLNALSVFVIRGKKLAKKLIDTVLGEERAVTADEAAGLLEHSRATPGVAITEQAMSRGI